MTSRELSAAGQQALEQVLGYLNFSTGQPDTRFFSNLNLLSAEISDSDGDYPSPAVWDSFFVEGLQTLKGSSAAFQEVGQATAVLTAVFQHALPVYFEFHRDLLFHQRAERTANAFFLGFVFQAVLQASPPYDEFDRLSSAAIRKLNDFVGYRPVATLEGKQIEVYAHEWVRPVPLYVREVGVVHGRHAEVVGRALELLKETDDDLLRAADFDPELMDELAYDPRAYDFEHPVNKRPNYHFGLWDPHSLDNQGRFRRFVMQEVTLNALMSRLTDEKRISREQLVMEAASVLAGTILMASGISGRSPETHDSNVNLGNLLPRIAGYRDAFYERLFDKVSGTHAKRLRKESDRLLQPFGGARQHLNTHLARLRASQVEHVHLSRIFAKMGHFEAAQRQADVVPVASARMRCRLDCLLTAGNNAIKAGELDEAAQASEEVVGLLHRAIECGALIDPWNILGFDANFSVFRALENSFHDHRADELVELVEQIFAFLSRIWSEAAARDDEALCARIDERYLNLAEWWHRFAVHEVNSVDAADAMDLYQASKHVAEALRLWHQGGAETGDVRFWAQHAMLFKTAQSHALVTDALLERGDAVACMALLVHWLSQAETIPLEQGEHSFHRLARRWLRELQAGKLTPRPEGETPDRWQLVQKFLDYLEANAGDYWQVPQFDLARASSGTDKKEQLDELFHNNESEDDEVAALFDAAYEDVIYRDSTDDGFDGSTFDFDDQPQGELIVEANRIAGRLEFLSCIANLWRTAVILPVNGNDRPSDFAQGVESRLPAVQQWVERILLIRQQLGELIDQIRSYRVPTPSFPSESLAQYDHHFVVESLLERVISTSVEIADAGRFLLSTLRIDSDFVIEDRWNLDPDEAEWIDVFAGVLQGTPERVRKHFPDFLTALSDKPLLYVPVNKNGSVQDIVAARNRQRCIQDLLASLPRLGLFVETCQLIESARAMERNNLVGPGAVTEFDELYKIGYRTLVTSLVTVAESWKMGEDEEEPEIALVGCLEQLTESLLIIWLAHSRTLRLSVLERVSDRRSWEQLVEFIEEYGEDLFSQRFLGMGNLRALLHEGVEQWLEHLQEEAEPEDIRLLADLDDKISRTQAAEQLMLVIEAIVENYAEYRDYNSTTTQSDRGNLLYTLLDFLRLRTQYDRVCWNLKPVIVAHDILERRGHTTAAKTWRRALVDRVREQSDQFVKRLKQLQKKYAMKMPTVADRIAERFVRPLAIDRIRALVEPAMDEAGREKCPRFELLEHETEVLTREPSGVGLDIPAWIVALDDEVDKMLSPEYERDERFDLETILPHAAMTYEELQQQLDEWTTSENE